MICSSLNCYRQRRWRRNAVQILLVALRSVVVPLLFPERAVLGFIGVVFGAREAMTDVPRTSFGAGTRCPPSVPRLLSCCVWRPKSIAFTQPVASPLLPALLLPI